MDEMDEILAEIEEENPHEEEIEAAESKADSEDDKMDRKLKKRYEELEKKIDQSEIKRIIKDFELDADEYENDFFGDLKAEIKDPRDAEIAVNKAKKYAAALKERTKKLEEEAATEAQAKASSAWGFQAPGRNAPDQTDEEKKQAARIAKGDAKEGIAAMMANDSLLGGIFQK